tara:strand:- start:2586 stop:2834 length:249 start_codon:yes stop_codon:yes gene_type:complete
MEEFERILTLSTGHMPNTSPRFGDYRVIKFEYGYVVWVSEYWEEAEDWFKPIMKYAYDNNCTLILFDNAEAVNEELFAVYDW